MVFHTTHAQTSADSIFTDIIPETPGAFQDVTIKLKSYSYNLLGSKITWTVDGKVVLSDTGAISYSFKTKDVGKATNIVITILTGGETIQKGISIQPQNVDMLWEAPDSYVPPFYKGKKPFLLQKDRFSGSIPYSKIFERNTSQDK